MPRVEIDIPESFSFSVTVPVRITDINYGGHLGNDSLLSILHEARMQYLQNIGCSELEAFSTSLIMADVSIIYRGEGFQGDLLEIQVKAGELSTRGFALFYLVTCKRGERDVLIAEARTGMLCFNYKTRKITTLPNKLREKLVI